MVMPSDDDERPGPMIWRVLTWPHSHFARRVNSWLGNRKSPPWTYNFRHQNLSPLFLMIHRIQFKRNWCDIYMKLSRAKKWPLSRVRLVQSVVISQLLDVFWLWLGENVNLALLSSYVARWWKGTGKKGENEGCSRWRCYRRRVMLYLWTCTCWPRNTSQGLGNWAGTRSCTSWDGSRGGRVRETTGLGAEARRVDSSCIESKGCEAEGVLT